MTADQRELLEKARESIAAARLLLEAGYAGFAASRAYYAMFYAAEALLEGKGLSFSKHSAVIAAFGKEFAKPGAVPIHFHKYLTEAYELRHTGDYAAPGAVPRERAAEQIERAEEFVAAAEGLIHSAGE